MSTLVELATRGELELYEPELGYRQQAMRLIYTRTRVWPWIEQHLLDRESEYESEITPIEQLDDLLNAFCAGETLIFSRQVKPIQHWGHGEWELKTIDLRLFGWFSKQDIFICCSIDFATRVKEIGLYNGYRDEAVRFRDLLDLDEPKFISGDDPSGVLTNISFPKS
jgi:hypothetical protein